MSEELLNQDAQTEVSSNQEPVAQENTQNESKTQEAVEPNKEQSQEREVPFHEHPRFRELVEQKNQFAERAKAFESQIRSLQEQMQRSQQVPQPKVEDKMIARLKSIDPEFGEYMEQLKTNLEKTQGELPQYKQWKEQTELETIRSQAFSTINNLHESNKVPKEQRDFYQSQIEAIVNKDPSIRVSDLPVVYKQVHDSYSKLFDNIRRQERESYVKGKSQDGKAPTVPLKGAPSPRSKAAEDGFTGDPDQDRAALVSSILAKARGQRNA